MNYLNKIIYGNALETIAQIPDGALDLIVTDPPYGVNYRDRSGRRVRNDDALDAVLPVFSDLFRALKSGGFCISFYGWNRIDRFMAAWKEAGFTVAGHIVWTKDYASRRRYLAYHHEQAYVLVKGQARLPKAPLSDVQPWTYSGNRAHPTEKAVEVMTPLVRSFCAGRSLGYGIGLAESAAKIVADEPAHIVQLDMLIVAHRHEIACKLRSISESAIIRTGKGVLGFITIQRAALITKVS